MKQLKTITVNALLEEISACETEPMITKLKALAEVELEGQDDITREVVMKVVYYKQHLISGSEAALKKLNRKNYRLANAHKIDFYDCAIGFIQNFDIPMVRQILNEQLPYDKATRDKVSAAKKALDLFERQCMGHVMQTVANSNENELVPN